MKIRLTVDGQVAKATLYDNATVRDFAALLPLSLTLTDYARIERIADLPRRLTQGSAETTVSVKAGDLAYYAPWGNLAIFVEYGTGHYTGDLMRLGAVETGLPALQCRGPLQVRIERIPERPARDQGGHGKDHRPRRSHGRQADGSDRQGLNFTGAGAALVGFNDPPCHARSQRRPPHFP
jgi:hypothetical protein